MHKKYKSIYIHRPLLFKESLENIFGDPTLALPLSYIHVQVWGL